MPQNTTASTGPSRWSRRRAGLLPAVPIDVGIRLGDDDRLSRLSLDVLTLILVELHPMDLVSMSQTCKAFRKFLMNPKASRSSIWKPVLETIEGLPCCPSDLNEPKFISWLYPPQSGKCDGCGTDRDTASFFELRLRLCERCVVDEQFSVLAYNDIPYRHPQFYRFTSLTILRDDMKYDEQIITMTPNLSSISSLHSRMDYDFDSEWNPGVGNYHTKTVAALADEYERVQDPKAKQAWLEEKERFWLDRTKHADACNNALNLERKKEEERLKEIRQQRVERMKEKLTELGWAREAEKYFEEMRMPASQFVHASRSRLTNEEWINFEPKLIPMMEKQREIARQEEIREHIEQRIHKWLKPAHTAFILSQPPNELNPSILDVALSDNWRTLLCTKPFDEDLNESLVEAASGNIPEIAEAWRKDRIGQLLDIVRKSKTYSGKEVTEDVLSLSSTIFRCTKCRPYRGYGDVHTYPHTLVHACNYPDSYSVKSLVEVVPQQSPAAPSSSSPPEHDFWPFGGTHRRREPIIRLDREEERHIVEALEYAGIWSGLSHIIFDDVAHEHMLSLLDALGWSRETSAAEMEERQPYVECLCECYHHPAEMPRRRIFRWKKAIYLCKSHLWGQERRPWFSKLNERDLATARKHEDAWETSTEFHCPWCHGRARDTYLHPNPSLLVHTACCFAIQQPHPPGLKEHAEKVKISPGEGQWLNDERSVLLVVGED